MGYTRITVNAHQMGGVPCIRGLRIPVATVVGMVADGMPNAEILESLPDLLQAGGLAAGSGRHHSWSAAASWASQKTRPKAA